MVVTLTSNSTQDHAVPATEFTDSKMVWQLQLPYNYLIQREFYVDYQITLQLSGAINNQVIYPSLSEFSTACNPLGRITRKMEVSLNGNRRVITDPSVINSALAWYQKDVPEFGCRTDPDTINNTWAAGRNVIGDALIDSMIGDSQFRHGPRFTATSKTLSPIGYVPYSRLDLALADGAPAVGTANDSVFITYRIRERLHHPLLVPASADESTEVLAGIHNITISLELGNLNSMCQTANVFNDETLVDPSICGPPLDPPIVTFTGWQRIAPVPANAPFYRKTPAITPVLRFRTFIPIVSIPRVLSMPYSEIRTLQFPTTGGAAPGDTDGRFDTDTLFLTQVPDRLYIFVRPLAEFTTTNAADAFGVITKLQIQTSYSTALLRDNDISQLYTISRRAGNRQDYNQFTDWVGSVICLDLTQSDISGVIVAQSGQFSLSISGEFKNTCYSSWNLLTGNRENVLNAPNAWQLVVIPESEGKLVLSNDYLTTSTGVSDRLIVKMLRTSRP